MIVTSDKEPQIERLTFDVAEALSGGGDPCVTLTITMRNAKGEEVHGISFDPEEIYNYLNDAIRAIADYFYMAGKYEGTLRENPLE